MHGPASMKSLVTTVVTPRKCPARNRPSSGCVTPSTSTWVENPGGYMDSIVGANTVWTPALRQRATSSSSVRG